MAKALVVQFDGGLLRSKREEMGLSVVDVAEQATAIMAKRKKGLRQVVLAEDVELFESGADCPSVSLASVFAYVYGLPIETMCGQTVVHYEPSALRAIRKDQKLSVRRLAEQVGALPAMVRKAETTGTDNGEFLLRILGRLSVTLPEVRAMAVQA